MSAFTTAAAAFLGLLPVPAAPAVQDAPTPGTIVVEPLAEGAAPPEVRRHFAGAVEAALGDAGFLVLPASAQGRYVARLTVTRTARGSVASDAAEAGPDTHVGNWGAALAVTLPSNKEQLRALVVTELKVAILLREGDRPVWSGSALTVRPQGTAGDAPAALASKLADAALRGFPEERAQPVPVP